MQTGYPLPAADPKVPRQLGRETVALEEVVIRPPGRFVHLSLRELWRYRHTLVRKAKQRVRTQYDDMVLGFVWAVARPLIMVGVFWAFRGLANAQVGVTIPYPLYVYSGLVFWFYFTEATTATAMSLQRDAGVIQKIYFPRLVSPISHLLAETYTLGLAAVPIAAMMLATGEYPGWHILLLPLVLLQLLILALGLGTLFSALVLKSRDWERTLKFVFYVGLWLSPVIYAVEMIPEHWKLLYLLNPMSGTLLAVRATLFSHFEFHWLSWIYSIAFSLGTLALGLLAFQRAERDLTDRL
jgi:lipopolysaccharide transport system permease protein